MLSSPLFPLPDGLEISSVSETPEEVLVRVTSHRSSSPCPHCSTPSSAIHSLYRRHPQDLPCAGRPIRLVFTVRKFFCRNPTCSRKVFTERLPDFLEASSRLTKRRCCHRIWWIIRQVPFEGISGWMFVIGQSVQATSSRGEAPIEFFCGTFTHLPAI